MRVAPPTPIGTGWEHTALGSYRVGGPPGPPAPNTHGNAAWTPPPPPAGAGLYDPTRDQHIEAEKLSAGQETSKLEGEKTALENSYSTGLGTLGQREAAQQHEAQRMLALLAEGYAKLGARQSEATNRLGVLNGGALVASATRRAANEAVTKKQDEYLAAQQRQAFENQRGQASAKYQEGAANLVNALKNAGLSQRSYVAGEEAGRSTEALKAGWEPPERPWSHERGGAVRVGGGAYARSRGYI
jgi:hypothetical protein